MKKNTFFAIVIMLMMSVSALAQSNSYNMVIEMANGTKMTMKAMVSSLIPNTEPKRLNISITAMMR